MSQRYRASFLHGMFSQCIGVLFQVWGVVGNVNPAMLKSSSYNCLRIYDNLGIMNVFTKYLKYVGSIVINEMNIFPTMLLSERFNFNCQAAFLPLQALLGKIKIC